MFCRKVYELYPTIEMAGINPAFILNIFFYVVKICIIRQFQTLTPTSQSRIGQTLKAIQLRIGNPGNLNQPINYVT